MSSILKVDQLQDSGGNAIITSDGSGNLTAGTIPAKTIGTGAIIQVQTKNIATSSGDSTSSTFADVTDYSLAITPNSTSNKIIVCMAFSPENKGTGTDRAIKYRFTRNGTEIFTQSYDCYVSGNSGQRIFYATPVYTDSPASTSELTYKLQYGIVGSNSTARINHYGEGSITLMEIAG